MKSVRKSTRRSTSTGKSNKLDSVERCTKSVSQLAKERELKLEREMQQRHDNEEHKKELKNKVLNMFQ